MEAALPPKRRRPPTSLQYNNPGGHDLNINFALQGHKCILTTNLTPGLLIGAVR
jgi:hypothetical protein